MSANRLVVTLVWSGLLAACAPSPAGGDLAGTDLGGLATAVLPPRYGFPLSPLGGSDVVVLGRVEASDYSPSATLELTLIARLAPGQRLVAHLREGKCDALGAIVGRLGELAAAQDGQATLVATRLDAGGDPQPLSLALLGEGSRVASVHDPAGVAVACGIVPAAPKP